MNKKMHDNDFIDEFDQLDTEVYKTFIELGLVIPKTENEVKIANEGLERIQVPPLPLELRDSSALVERLRREQVSSLKAQISEDTQITLSDGIIGTAKKLNLSNFQLADITGLSVVLIAQFDRGLIKVNKSLPVQKVKQIAAAINVTTEQVLEYLRLGPRFANDMNFKATDSPTLPEAQDFTDAVRQDPTSPLEKRKELLALVESAEQ